jgi:hypothetical protein
MNCAIVGVCFDPRQSQILEITLPSWRRYGKRHGLPVIIIERDHADGDFYWNKHLLYRIPELKPFARLLFLDNDVFVNSNARPLLTEWDSPLIGATFESTQFPRTREFISSYYDEYFVDRHADDSSFEIVNTGVLVIPKDQGEFLESVYRNWKLHVARLPKQLSRPTAPFTFSADQPHVSYELQAQSRYRHIDERFNTLWWQWYRRSVNSRHRSFLLRSKAAALSRNLLPRAIWNVAFEREREIFHQALCACDFLHVAGSKSAVFLGR